MVHASSGLSKKSVAFVYQGDEHEVAEWVYRTGGQPILVEVPPNHYGAAVNNPRAGTSAWQPELAYGGEESPFVAGARVKPFGLCDYVRLDPGAHLRDLQ